MLIIYSQWYSKLILTFLYMNFVQLNFSFELFISWIVLYHGPNRPLFNRFRKHFSSRLKNKKSLSAGFVVTCFGGGSGSPLYSNLCVSHLKSYFAYHSNPVSISPTFSNGWSTTLVWRWTHYYYMIQLYCICDIFFLYIYITNFSSWFRKDSG